MHFFLEVNFFPSSFIKINLSQIEVNLILVYGPCVHPSECFMNSYHRYSSETAGCDNIIKCCMSNHLGISQMASDAHGCTWSIFLSRCARREQLPLEYSWSTNLLPLMSLNNFNKSFIFFIFISESKCLSPAPHPANSFFSNLTFNFVHFSKMVSFWNAHNIPPGWLQFLNRFLDPW